MTQILPSLLACDFLNLNQELTRLEEAGVDALHFDVMDGQFVPNISIGLPILEAVRKGTSLPIDVHLMIEQPETYIEAFKEAGADMISVHVEATNHIHRAIQLIHDYGIKAGVVLNPGTPIESIKHVLDAVDYVLIMSVNPGFGGQAFIPSMVGKIRELNDYKTLHQLDFDIEVDGGINDETAKACISNGATMLVAGSYFFKHAQYREAVQLLKGE
ncbi:ribulose-phosphate 3-epimerase [Staphylococcus massiliensis]|uniref:Ribulose-phosphate 3-epimerase n=1 Tax=Staphylococcus massiliensis S46 TaxID=1229783 RepID=K9AT15_9STAP|nr:ribulose-phosphate 3-epimerase [Staphylococcus massiliensis]EKU50424.1 ribulose-phosphate 3-epimerase [Staphylococcus massiliensis S46]MCG3398806.1 ribulose-phosphate 3-epimerase [Staphylococcus massiliensis]MCG3411851.1 ribulose-phosphate 3-epimerase [Staphylococcus massiliensis]POA00501.1 ribulose-phosphate 3-epimerase [Staphylococcus massiliensis CCUG 55927]